MPQGAVSLQLARMLRESIASTVTQAVRHAVEQDVPVRVEGLRVREGEQQREAALEVLPIHTMAPRAKCYLVLFTPTQQIKTARVEEREPPAGDGHEPDHVVERLRQDLASQRARFTDQESKLQQANEVVATLLDPDAMRIELVAAVPAMLNALNVVMRKRPVADVVNAHFAVCQLIPDFTCGFW